MRRCAAVIVAATLSALPLRAGEIPAAALQSGYRFMSSDSRTMQDDDTANPGILAVLEGETLWSTKQGRAAKACADCHGDANTSMKGVAARYPAFDATRQHPLDLEGRINNCRAEHQEASPLAPESPELLALSAYVARQSRGQPITTGDDPALAPFVAQGRALYMQREGQLNLACTNCHDDNWDKHLAGAPITQGQPTGYPVYRLEWQSMGSLARRIRGCMTGVRAQAFDFGSPEMVALELYVMSRARGMTMETPAVRP